MFRTTVVANSMLTPEASKNRLRSGAYIVRALCLCQVIFMTFLLPLGCNQWSTESGKNLKTGYRITAKAVEDGQISFHPTLRKAVFVRNYPEDEKLVTDPNQNFRREIWEVDLTIPEKPYLREIKALRGGYYPSYAGDKGIVALNDSSSLVFLKNGAEIARTIKLEGLPGLPSRPKASPNGSMVAFFSLVPEKNSEFGALSKRHQLFIIPIEGGQVKQMTNFKDQSKIVEQLYWRTENTIHLVYRITDFRGRIMYRVERLDLSTGDFRLALFTDFHNRIYLSNSERFFVMGEHPSNTLRFYSRDTNITSAVDLEGGMTEAAITPDEKWVLTARYFEEGKGINLQYIQVPQSIASLRAIPE